MIYIVNKSTNPAYNIALEEFCFKELKQFDKIFILWINEPAIIVGKHQNTLAEINARFVEENGIHVVRRITGGGAVYHDLNNLNYTIISNEEEGENDFDFRTFSQPVIETLGGLGAKAEFSGRNDITIDGKKICGNAQAYAGNRVMHHGCLLFDTDLTVLAKALEVSNETVDFKGVKSVRSRVDNILPNLPEKITVHEFADKILEQMKRKFPEMKEYHFSETEKSEIEKTLQEKFGNWDWTYGHNPVAEVVREKRYPAGRIQTFLNIGNGKIKGIRFYGTFFGKNSDLSVPEEVLKGVKYTSVEVRNVLSQLDTSQYFAGFSLDELTEAIVD
ncbi:lipoate--protein ligase [uncultured Proteiniphilum sp.]|uniref:lipoate--protein ligase n=1 Tax=uncultured Proteiniphilum sp. TaxID=497637 RepID=UPI00260FA3C5|nr:lipoate--protein ligase [uncultured Proteiniphilum sp.]